VAADPALIPDPAHIARFRADLGVLTGRSPCPERRLGVAVSGGGDSLALLLLAAAAFPGAVVAATVDHGLRVEAAAEAAMVGGVCRRLGVPHVTLPIPPGFTFDGNLPDQARRARYAVLAGWAADGRSAATVPWIATGHQRDDVAETFLMRARRGAGLTGLAAMPVRRPVAPLPESPLLVRPLLGWSRADLAAIVAAAGLRAVDDPTNADPARDRARLRALLATAPDLPAARLARAAHNLRDAEEALAWATAREWEARHEVEAPATLWLDPAGLPHELKRRLVDRALAHVRSGCDPAATWRGGAVDRMVRLLEAGRPATLAGILARPGVRWCFTPAPPRRTG
jgi:tRNA(Ile)-lysidine synthase